MATASEENAISLYHERNAPFKASHTYQPTGWDSSDPRGIVGEAINPGSSVQLLKLHTKNLHRGMPPKAKTMFNVIRDEQGNRQNVSKNSISRIFHDRRDGE